MSQRDLVAELRAARVEAPSQVRERVLLVAAPAPTPPRRFRWRRAFVALPVAAAVAAAVVLTRPSTNHSAADTERAVSHGAAAQTAPRAKAFAVPNTPTRAQSVGETLSLRVRDVSDAVKRAVRITGALGGYTTSVHASTSGEHGAADLTLRLPRTRLQDAVTRLSLLGTITAEHVDVTDRQGDLNTADRTITRLQKQLAALRAQQAPQEQITALTRRIEALQRQEAAIRRSTRYATVKLHLATPATTAVRTHGHGPLHGVGVTLRWLGIGAVYAVAIGLPVLVLLALAWLAARTVRRRREEALLSGR
jgi:Domain of unknown function (DUF4349)